MQEYRQTKRIIRERKRLAKGNYCVKEKRKEDKARHRDREREQEIGVRETKSVLELTLELKPWNRH